MIGKTAYKPIAVFNPLPWQIAPWRDKAPILLLTGSAGGGKSRLAAEKVHGYCKKYPGATWLILRKAREWTARSIVAFYAQTVVGNDPAVRYNKSEGTFYYDNGSVVYSGGMMDEQQRESVRSIGGAGGLDGAWMEEGTAFTRQDFEELRARMRHQAADWRQIIVTTNPGGSSHWIVRDLINGKQAHVYKSGATDNPYNPHDYLDSLNALTGVLHKRLVEGIWATAEGAVYEMFDHSIYVCERPLTDFQNFALAMDEGYTNPAVILLVGIDGDGRWHVVKEYYERGKLQDAVCEAAQAWVTEYNVSAAAVDEAAAGLIADLLNRSVPASAAKGRVLDGIQAIQNRLKVQGDGRPRLTVDPGCVNTINEFESYVWKPGKDEPVKENDHTMDALRYLNDLLGGETWLVW